MDLFGPSNKDGEMNIRELSSDLPATITPLGQGGREIFRGVGQVNVMLAGAPGLA